MLLLSAILSLTLMALTYFMFRREQTKTQDALLPAVGGVAIGLCLVVPTLQLHAALVIPALCLWKWRQWPAHTLLVYMVLAGLGSYSLFAFAAAEQIAEYQRLRTEYPFESMEKRVPAPKRHAGTKLSKETEDHLSRLEKSIGDDSNGFRMMMLERLHQDSVQSFIASPGFGFGRRFQPTDSSLKFNLDHDGTPIPQPGLLPQAYYPEDDLREPIEVEPEPLREMHLNSVINFANPRGFGLVVSRQKTAGFQSHHFNMVPHTKEWKVQTIELVGLLMHQDPVVYISDELPRMEKLREVPTRSLNVFETVGIKRLQAGDDLFIRETTEIIRMIGAVRSIEECAKCHGGERGDLLGAFSYRLQRVP
jgi:hypothetical protein